jgi:ribosome-associated protein
MRGRVRREGLIPRLAPKALARACTKLALDKKAEDVVIIDLRKLNAPTDYFVICSGSTDKHVKAIAENIATGMKKKKNTRAWHVEGQSVGSWVLIDYVDVVVHVFSDATRRFYSLETLWGDAPIEEIKPAVRGGRK